MDHFHSVMAGSGVRLVDCDTLGNALRRGEGRDRRRAYEVRLTAVRRSPLQYLRRHGRLDVERCVALDIMAHAIAVFFGASLETANLRTSILLRARAASTLSFKGSS